MPQVRKIADAHSGTLHNENSAEKAEIPQQKRQKHSLRLRLQHFGIVERIPAAPEQQISRNDAEARHPNPKQAVAKEDAQPVEGTIQPQKGTCLGIERHMHEDDAGDQKYTHQIDTGGNVLVNIQTSYPFWATPPVVTGSIRAAFGPQSENKDHG